MPRSRNLHYVQHQVDLTQSDDPDLNWADGLIQVDEVLSKKYGRTIRNGNNFRLVGYGATLRAKSGRDEVDTGFACTVGIQYCPTTKHSADAWNMMYKSWLQQKKLKSAVGRNVRYDDLEMGWDGPYTLPTARNSVIAMEGIDDAFEEKIVLYGTSNPGTHVSLESFWDNMKPVPAPSQTPFGTVIKTAKYDDVFPDRCTLYCSSTFSSMLDVGSTPDSLGGALALSEIDWLPSDNHINHMTGTLFFYVKGIPYDTGAQIEDELTLIITLVYEGWSPLVNRPKKSLPRSRTASKTKKTYKSRRKKS